MTTLACPVFLAAECGLRLTYMEVRFLLDDLKIQPKDKAPASAPRPLDNPTAKGPAEPEAMEEDLRELEETMPEEAIGGKVSVTVDQVTRPGAVASGKVTFGDGHTAQWYLDQMGRLGVASPTQGYRPSQQDLMAFQQELQQELAKMGM